MIHRYSPKNENLWAQGKMQVQVCLPGQTRPIAYCDGTEADIAELRAIAEEEGTELPEIHRRVLKTGREIWTIGEARPPEDLEDFED